MKIFYRKTLFQNRSLDSIQAILEIHEQYGTPSGCYLCFAVADKGDPHSTLAHILRLQDEGYVRTTWDSDQYSDRNLLKLESISLTIEGYKLLEELKAKSKWGNLKKKISDLFWVVVTSIVTTLVVLWIKSC
jgi:hypothetical protein